MGQILNAFEDHAVSVMPGLAACADAWSMLARLGVAEGDLGVVVSGAQRYGTESVNGRLFVPFESGRGLLHASQGYPADMIAASDKGASSGLGELLSEREAKALADAIVAAGASLWVRTRSPDMTSRAAEVLLALSTERVRTFSRPSPRSIKE